MFKLVSAVAAPFRARFTRHEIQKYKIFESIPHQRIISNNDEIFDLYQLGLFANETDKQENIELVQLPPCKHYKPHYHKQSSAVIYVVHGYGTFQLNNEFIAYQPQKRITIPLGALHGFKTQTSTLFLSIQSPPILNRENGFIDLYYGDDHVEQ